MMSELKQLVDKLYEKLPMRLSAVRCSADGAIVQVLQQYRMNSISISYHKWERERLKDLSEL